jgi:NAD(P)-dependent dehydrogenase (short-subunit alcohol dehydrogenase family)
MGLATAKLLGAEHSLVLSDVKADRLDAAVAELRGLGFDADGVTCDVTNPASVHALADQAASLGELAVVVHTAGVSPQMGAAESIIRINTLGTVNVTSAFLDRATEGFRIVNVASMSAYMVPRAIAPQRAYPLALTDQDAFFAKVMRRVNLTPKAQRSAIAYPISKHFVVWYSKQMAAAFGAKGARIVSVSPGSIDTEMGRLEEAHGGGELLQYAAFKRLGTIDEIAVVLAFCASESASYLTGTDILCDGGTIAGVTWKDLIKVRP